MSGPDWSQYMTLSADVHMNVFTQITHRLYPAEDRVTVTLEGTNSARLTVFLPRLELLRLRDTLTAVALDLDNVADEPAADDGGAMNSAA